MNTMSLRSSTILVLAISGIAGCGANSAVPTTLPPSVMAANFPDTGLPHHKTFKYTGKVQSFVVPAHVTSLSVDVRGAAGGGTSYGGHDYFGRGGRVFALIPVRPHEELYVFVGGEGSAKSGGFNGGGNSGPGGGSYGGGGGSDIRHRLGLSTRLVAAAGGGGEGSDNRQPGGNGGGKNGENGGSYCYTSTSGCGNGGGGGGGMQTAGGYGGSAGGAGSSRQGHPGSAGVLGSGGNGGAGGCTSSSSRCDCGYANGCPGAGGGGGYYGGGGGGGGAADVNFESYSTFGGGGGGGSSWAESKAVNVKMWTGWNAAIGSGLVVLNWR